MDSERVTYAMNKHEPLSGEIRCARVNPRHGINLAGLNFPRAGHLNKSAGIHIYIRSDRIQIYAAQKDAAPATKIS